MTQICCSKAFSSERYPASSWNRPHHRINEESNDEARSAPFEHFVMFAFHYNGSASAGSRYQKFNLNEQFHELASLHPRILFGYLNKVW